MFIYTNMHAFVSRGRSRHLCHVYKHVYLHKYACFLSRGRSKWCKWRHKWACLV